MLANIRLTESQADRLASLDIPHGRILALAIAYFDRLPPHERDRYAKIPAIVDTPFQTYIRVPKAIEPQLKPLPNRAAYCTAAIVAWLDRRHEFAPEQLYIPPDLAAIYATLPEPQEAISIALKKYLDNR